MMVDVQSTGQGWAGPLSICGQLQLHSMDQVLRNAVIHCDMQSTALRISTADWPLMTGQLQLH